MDALNEFKAVCLQRYPEYFEQTITLLNNQWPRSRTARMRSLEQGSGTSLPTSLVLLQQQDNEVETVVAHSKVSPVPYSPQLCFVESVVVEPRLRGKGIGRLIMEKTEAYVKSLGITTVYLTTFDQQAFYSRLGYKLCDPIVVFGGSLKLVERAENIGNLYNSTNSQSSDNHTGQRESTNSTLTKEATLSEQMSNVNIVTRTAPPPAPPPPPPSPSCQFGTTNRIEASKVTMRKFL